jgi:hypothetical protein
MYLTVHAKALNRAAQILGGRDRLREYLRVPASHLALWLAGTEKQPLDVFLKVVDLISDGWSSSLSAALKSRSSISSLE